jgi:hypothetical protein
MISRLNKSAFTLVVTLTLAHSLSAQKPRLDETPQTAGSLTLKSIIFEVRDKQKVEAESGQLMVPEKRGNARAKLIALAFIRFKSTAEKPASPIVYLAGAQASRASTSFGECRSRC